MIKKIAYFLGCIVPMTAMGVSYQDPTTGNSWGGDGLLAIIDTSVESAVVQSGNGAAAGAGGVNITGGLLVGTDYSGTAVGNLYFENATDSVITMTSKGDVNIAGQIDVTAAKDFTLKTDNSTINVSIGSIKNLGKLNIHNVGALTIGTSVESSADTTLSAVTIDVGGGVANNAGIMNITATGAIDLGLMVNKSTTNITGASLQSGGNVQNNLGTTEILLTGNMNITGRLENSGDQMSITAGAINVSGTMKNDNPLGKMVINGSSLNVSGGDASENPSNPSFVNSGDFVGVISGNTHFEYGIDVSAATISNTFYLETGSFSFGAGTPANLWAGLFSNKLSLFELIVTNDDLTVHDIVNGVGNSAAQMHLQGQGINANDVDNVGGELKLVSTGAGVINISGIITNDLGSTTIMNSANGLNVAGQISNDGDLELNGLDVSLSSVVNKGDLEISTLTSTSASIYLSSNLTNESGTVTVEGRQITIDGDVKNEDGVTNIFGSDAAGGAVVLGSVEASGGTINLNSKVGGINVTNAVTVNDGALNLLSDTHGMTAGGTVNISGNVTASGVAAISGGDVNISAAGVRRFEMVSTAGAINIDGNVTATEDDFVRSVLFDAALIDIGGNVVAGNKGRLIFGSAIATNVDIDGALVSNAGGVIELNAAYTELGTISGAGKFIARGTTIDVVDAVDNAVNIENGIWFDGTDPTIGFVVDRTMDLTIHASGIGADIKVAGGISVGGRNTLTLKANDKIDVSGIVFNEGHLRINAYGTVNFANDITNNGIMSVAGISIDTQDIENTGTQSLVSPGDIAIGEITNSGNMTIDGAVVSAIGVSNNAGGMDVTADALNLMSLAIMGGYVTLHTDLISVQNTILLTGDLAQGDITGMLNLTKDNTVLTAENLIVAGDFNAVQNSVEYNITNAFSAAGNTIISNLASVDISASRVITDDLDNAGTLLIVADDVDLGDVINSGQMNINSGLINALIVNSFTTTDGGVKLIGDELNSAGAVTLSGRLLQNGSDVLSGGDVNLISNDYILNAAQVTAGGIDQVSGKMLINTDSLTVNGNIDAMNLRVAAAGANWLNVDVAGDVSGGVDFIGLAKMTIGGDYLFNDTSTLHMAILPRATQDYWASVSLNNDNTLGQITNLSGAAEPLISIEKGKFITDMSGTNPNMHFGWNNQTSGSIQEGQFGISVFDIVDQGSAIWLLHADGGIDETGKKIRNAVVRFCNNDGSLCYNYLDSLGDGSIDEDDLPAYISLRDTDGDGIGDSLYLVFDPRFGGPVEIFKIQPIVDREPVHTFGEYDTAGALDDLIEGQAKQAGFFHRNPIETIPLMFKGSNMETAANELYDRMEQYLLDHDGSYLARFSRLFQPREMEQIVGSITLNEHTTFRDFEDHMMDEFIWNRHRNTKKTWLDIDFGMIRQNTDDDLRISSDRLSVMGGFDWQVSETLIMGITAHASHTTGTSMDKIDLGYKSGQPVLGRVDIDVTNTNVGLGAYMMKILGSSARLYGNAFVDLHMFDIAREQNFVEPIDGTGTALSVISEWGLLHDILNQYIVGNIYARAGYNFGFTVTERTGDVDYMNLQSDAYFMLTPGYSVTAQKRIYPSAWFQMRPYLSVGAEYDVLGAPSEVQFKFAPAMKYTDYTVDIDPLWVNGGGGIEFLAASGFQFGLDYRYQYNADIQMHKIKLSGSYRF